jgi:transcriptional antiterminator RfaH
MHWYLIHTKPRQELRALENLERQGYECYLPLLPTEKIQQKLVAIVDEPLFPRYLFIRLDSSQSGKSWAPIRSTLGVSKLVTFGMEPAKVDHALIEFLRESEAKISEQPQRLFDVGDRLLVTDGPFAGIEAIYQMSNGEGRVMVLIELLSKPVKVVMAPQSLKKVS